MTTGTATAGEEFTPAAGTVEFKVGQTVATVQVIVYGDSTYESVETVNVMFSGSELVAPVTASGLIRHSDWYVLSDTGANLAAAPIAARDGAQSIDATDDAITLIGEQVTERIVSKIDSSDDVVLNAQGAALSGLSAWTLGSTNALDASDNAVTLTGSQVTETIIAKFDPSDRLTLQGPSYTLLQLSRLDDANVVLDATENNVTLTGGSVTDAMVTKFDPSDDLTLFASGATLSTLSATALSDPDVPIHRQRPGAAGL